MIEKPDLSSTPTETSIEDIQKDKQRQLANWLSAILKASGLTQRELARRLNKEASYISKVLAGEVNLTLKTVCEIELALGVPIIQIPDKLTNMGFVSDTIISDGIDEGFYSNPSLIESRSLDRLSILY